MKHVLEPVSQLSGLLQKLLTIVNSPSSPMFGALASFSLNWSRMDVYHIQVRFYLSSNALLMKLPSKLFQRPDMTCPEYI